MSAIFRCIYGRVRLWIPSFQLENGRGQGHTHKPSEGVRHHEVRPRHALASGNAVCQFYIIFQVHFMSLSNIPEFLLIRQLIERPKNGSDLDVRVIAAYLNQCTAEAQG